jgi:SAM-dependent methyltransferase
MTQAKRLPLHRRPFFAKRILEVGGGHAPYAGVTHAVDKFPGDDFQRAGAMVVETGVVFSKGELESIPFPDEPKFDFLYASHVLEHVGSIERAVSEINRVARQGYIETPNPLREQISCPYPFDPKDFHIYFSWVSARDPGALHALRKTAASIGEFCDCENGRFARALFVLRRERGLDPEPLLPGAAKATRMYFTAPVRLVVHQTFREACAAGFCAYESARVVKRSMKVPRVWSSKRFRKLHAILELCASEKIRVKTG